MKIPSRTPSPSLISYSKDLQNHKTENIIIPRKIINPSCLSSQKNPTTHSLNLQIPRASCLFHPWGGFSTQPSFIIVALGFLPSCSICPPLGEFSHVSISVVRMHACMYADNSSSHLISFIHLGLSVQGCLTRAVGCLLYKRRVQNEWAARCEPVRHLSRSCF